MSALYSVLSVFVALILFFIIAEVFEIIKEQPSIFPLKSSTKFLLNCIFYAVVAIIFSPLAALVVFIIRAILGIWILMREDESSIS